jgi:hypothetical protein
MVQQPSIQEWLISLAMTHFQSADENGGAQLPARHRSAPSYLRIHSDNIQTDLSYNVLLITEQPFKPWHQ